jgi:hypothetical protein
MWFMWPTSSRQPQKSTMVLPPFYLTSAEGITEPALIFVPFLALLLKVVDMFLHVLTTISAVLIDA